MSTLAFHCRVVAIPMEGIMAASANSEPHPAVHQLAAIETIMKSPPR